MLNAKCKMVTEMPVFAPGPLGPVIASAAAPLATLEAAIFNTFQLSMLLHPCHIETIKPITGMQAILFLQFKFALVGFQKCLDLFFVF